MDYGIRRWLALGLLTMVALGTSRADVLVMKSGELLAGKVTEEGDVYVVELPKGGKIRYPKAIVREVITDEVARARLETELKKANLASEQDVTRLTKLARDYGLEQEREKILISSYELRLAAAPDDPQALGALASWCALYKLTAQAEACQSRTKALRFKPEFESQLAKADLGNLEDVERLCEFARKHGLEKERQRMLTRTYKLKLAAAGNDAMVLAKLANWCESNNLKPEALEAEKAALDIAPEALPVRRTLGYVWDKEGKNWHRPWRVSLLEATLTARYEEGSLLVKPVSEKGTTLARLEIEFEACSSAPHAANRFLAMSAIYPKAHKMLEEWLAKEWLKKMGEDRMPDVPLQLFESIEAKLVLPGGVSITPGFMSDPGGDGWTLHADGRTCKIEGRARDDRPVPQYFRADDRQVALIRPFQTIRLTLLYEVPDGTKKATLRFYACRPIEVQFGR